MNFKENLRLHLLSLGFVPSVTEVGTTGVIYCYHECSTTTDIDITVDISNMVATAIYPDFDYNRNNPYAKKDIKASYSLIEESDFHNLDKFIQLSISLASKK